LFSNEYYVMVNGSSGYYVSREDVTVIQPPSSDKPVDGFVLGYIVEQAGSKTLVQLSGEPAVGGLRTWVEATDVKAA
jgi:hypothetical protein